jgi:hypothetical protein
MIGMIDGILGGAFVGLHSFIKGQDINILWQSGLYLGYFRLTVPCPCWGHHCGPWTPKICHAIKKCFKTFSPHASKSLPHSQKPLSTRTIYDPTIQLLCLLDPGIKTGGVTNPPELCMVHPVSYPSFPLQRCMSTGLIIHELALLKCDHSVVRAPG